MLIALKKHLMLANQAKEYKITKCYTKLKLYYWFHSQVLHNKVRTKGI